jgi:hypothetical protein
MPERVVGDADPHRFLIHDRDRIFAEHLDDSIKALGIEVLRLPVASRKANGICERVIGTIRRECLDWLFPMSEAHLRAIRPQRSLPVRQRMKTKSLPAICYSAGSIGYA